MAEPERTVERDVARGYPQPLQFRRDRGDVRGFVVSLGLSARLVALDRHRLKRDVDVDPPRRQTGGDGPQIVIGSIGDVSRFQTEDLNVRSSLLPWSTRPEEGRPIWIPGHVRVRCTRQARPEPYLLPGS